MSTTVRDRSAGPFDLTKTPIHLGLGAGATSGALPIAGFAFDGPSFETYMRDHCADGVGGRLLMVETSPTDWPIWERHDAGDEIVMVLAGRAEFIQEIDGEERRLEVGPGQTMINPQGVWHTADVIEAMRALYITPIAGTEHRPR